MQRIFSSFLVFVQRAISFPYFCHNSLSFLFRIIRLVEQLFILAVAQKNMLKKKFFSYEFLKNIENNFLKDAEVFY